MSIISALEDFMVNKNDYYMIENSENTRRYRRKWMELEEEITLIHRIIQIF